MAWTVVDALIHLRDEINYLNPNRDKGSDGTIGDSRHTSTSDHTPDEQSHPLRNKDRDSNDEVHALDADSTGPWPPNWSMNRIVGIVVYAHRVGILDVLEYIIWDHHIASKSSKWMWEIYRGDDPHTGHAHFSCKYGSGTGPRNPENYNGTWFIRDLREEEELMDSNVIKAIAKETAEQVWASSGRDGGVRETVFDRLAHIDSLIDDINEKLDKLTPPPVS